MRMPRRETVALPKEAEAVGWCCHPPGRLYSPLEPNSLCTAQGRWFLLHGSLSPSFWLSLRRRSTPSTKPHGPRIRPGQCKPIPLMLCGSQLPLGHHGEGGRRCSFVCCLLVKGRRTERLLPWMGQSIFSWMGI